MKKYLALFLIIAAIVSTSSCSGLVPQPTASPSSSPSSEPTTAQPSSSSSPSPTESAAVRFLAGEPTAPELGIYLKQNAAALSPEDGDLLLERLLLAQRDISFVMNTRIWDEAYLTSLNETLGGILDAGKIQDIADQTVRDDFQQVADSMMTMVRYEETPVFEPDWATLEAMKEVFGMQAAVMIEYQSRLQGRYYFGDPFNFDLMAADIVAVEEILKKTDSGFVRWQLEHVYTVQVGRLLYGPEGYFLGLFTSGDKQVVSNIEKYAGLYAESSFGTVCKNLLALRGEGDQAVSDYISDSLLFPPDDPRGRIKVSIDYNGAKIEAPQLTGMQDADVMEKINTSILDAAKALVTSGRNNQLVSSYINFVNSRYINITFLYSYRNESDMDSYSESSLLLDLGTAGIVSFNDLVGKPFEAYKDQLLLSIRDENTPKDLKEPVRFMINREDLIISVPSTTSDWPDYFTVTWNGLRSFMDISKLY